MFKTCTKCKIEQPVESFSKGGPSRSPDGLQYWCKSCVREHDKKYRLDRKEAIETRKKEYYEDNKIEILSSQKTKRAEETPKEKQKRREYGVLYRSEHKEEISLAKKLWAENNKEAVKQSRSQYYLENKDSFSESRRIYRQLHKKERNEKETARRKTDPQYRLSTTLRGRFKRALKGDYKTGSAVRDLGCSIDEVKSYLESKFQEGMTWDNYGAGKGRWHVDHIMPLSAFDLTDRQHVILACNYLNLQPLWQEDNLRKHNNIPIFQETILAT